MPDTKFPFLEVHQSGKEFILTRLPAGLLTRISYASVRGIDTEPGAVQRLLNARRINSVKAFTLAGGDYPNVIVLNWVAKDKPISRQDDAACRLMAEEGADCCWATVPCPGDVLRCHPAEQRQI